MDENIKFEEILNIANIDIKNGHYQSAVQKLEDIIIENVEFGKAYNHLGWLYETKFKNYEKAEKYYKQALFYSPEYPAIYTNYAVLLSTLNKYDELKEHLKNALKITGIDKATIYNEYGIMYEQLGNFNEAIKSYKQCALTTLSKDVLTRAKESIERCNIKQSL